MFNPPQFLVLVCCLILSYSAYAEETVKNDFKEELESATVLLNNKNEQEQLTDETGDLDDGKLEPLTDKLKPPLLPYPTSHEVMSNTAVEEVSTEDALAQDTQLSEGSDNAGGPQSDGVDQTDSSSPNVKVQPLVDRDGEHQVVAGTKPTEGVGINGLPRATQTLDDYLQAQIFHSEEITPQQQPSAAHDPPALNHLQGTEMLKSISPGTWEGISKLPVGVGGLAVDVIKDPLITTQFSGLDEELLDATKKVSDEEEFPTFDKWSKQYLAEQEKQKIEKIQEKVVVNQANVVNQKKLRQNYAAASCGAKVIASNAEAENINYLLNGNPDEYMLNPCKAKKWFVVELCEPLQIHRVELGTMELFSSQPKSFRVFSSQRFPTKEWITLGKFEMTPDRVVQSFQSQLSDEFVKFVRVEMLEHHGEEHYCPLTTFRVLGIDMASDGDDETEAEPEGPATTGDLEEDPMEEPVNLFTSAKETVVKLVKKVLYKGDQEGQAEPAEANQESNVPLANSTEPAEEKQIKADTKPCIDSDVHQESESTTPGVAVPSAGVITPPSVSKVVEEMPIITKLGDTDQLPVDSTELPVVIKLEQEGEGGHLQHSPSVCVYSPWSTYVQLMSGISYPPTCSTGAQKVWTLNQDSARSTEASVQESLGQVDTGSTPLVTSMSPESAAEKRSDDPASSVPPSQPDPATLDTDQSPPHVDVDSSQSAGFTSAGVSVTRSELLEPSSVSSQSGLENEAVSVLTPGLHIQQSQVVEQGATDLAETIFLKVSPSPTMGSDYSQEGLGEDLFETPTVMDRSGQLPGTVQPTREDESGQGDEDLTQGTLDQRRLQAENDSAVRSLKPMDLLKVGMPTPGKRDISMMKLNNRILALEQNVSMTKKYLEELSRAFKQQNEEMMKLLNKTEKRLNVYISQAEEKELRHEAHVDLLEQKVLNLTEYLDDLQLQMDAMAKKLYDGQFLLAFLQAVLFVWLVISSYRGRSKHGLSYSDHQFLLDTMPKQPVLETSTRQRRKSDVGIQQDTGQQKAMKRQSSDTNLACNSKVDVSSDKTSLLLSDLPQISKKKKRKKLKHEDPTKQVLSSGVKCPTADPSSSFSSAAGVLFGVSDVIESSSGQARAGAFSWNQATAKDLGALSSKTRELHRTVPQNTDKSSCENVYSSSDLGADSDSDLCAEDAGPSRQHNGDTLSQISAGQSPEFKLPSYHKHKLGKARATHVFQSKPELKNTRHLSFEDPHLRPKEFVNPAVGQDYFLTENYLQENRFKFPASPAKESSSSECLSCDQAPGQAQFCPRCSNFVLAVQPAYIDLSARGMQACPHVTSQQHADNYPANWWYTSHLPPSPALVHQTHLPYGALARPKSSSILPSFIPIEHCSNQKSFMAPPHRPQPHTGTSRILSRTKLKKDGQPVSSGQPVSVGHSTPVAVCNVEQAGSSKGFTAGLDSTQAHLSNGGQKKNVHQTHKRKSSFPTEVHSKNVDSQRRQSSLDEPELAGKPPLSRKPTPPTLLTKKGSSSKTSSANDIASIQMLGKKGNKS